MSMKPHTTSSLCLFSAHVVLRLILASAVILTSTGCKKKTPPPPAPTSAAGSLATLSSATSAQPQPFSIARPSDNVSIDGGTDSYAHVTYAPAVKMFDLSDIKSSLQGISSDGHGFVFKNASPAIRALKTGDILFVKNQLAAKVLGSITDGDTTLVLVGEAPLRDVVQSGEINIDAPIHFHGPKQVSTSAPQPRSFFDLLVPPVYAAQSGLKGSGADVARQQGTQDAAKTLGANALGGLVDGWKIVQWTVTPGDNQMNFQAVLSKDAEGFIAMVGMKGWISNTDFVSKISLTNGAGKQAFSGVKNTKGSIEFDWEIGKASPGVWAKEDRVKLPAGFTVPLAPLLEGLPLTLDISAALLIHPALTGGNEYSKGGFTVSWGNGNHETSSSGAVDTSDSSNTIETTYNVTADTNVSPVAPNGMVISYCAPRIELRLDALGTLADSVNQLGGAIDQIESRLMSLMPQSVQNAVAQSPLSNVTASNILSSNADVFIQFITTEGVTHSSNVTPFPCSKQEIKLTAQGGGDAQLFGLTSGATTTTDLFTKTFTRWDPASDFCKKV